MISIYKIEDINDLTYVGSTSTTLNRRLSQHRSDKRLGHYCSSSKLNLDNCIILLLEECSKENRKQRESYWINHIDCVNDLKLDHDNKKYTKEYRQKNKGRIQEYREKNKEKLNAKMREYNEKNKEKLNAKMREYYEQNKDKIHAKRREQYRIMRQRHRLQPESPKHVPSP